VSRAKSGGRVAPGASLDTRPRPGYLAAADGVRVPGSEPLNAVRTDGFTGYPGAEPRRLPIGGAAAAFRRRLRTTRPRRGRRTQLDSSGPGKEFSGPAGHPAFRQHSAQERLGPELQVDLVWGTSAGGSVPDLLGQKAAPTPAKCWPEPWFGAKRRALSATQVRDRWTPRFIQASAFGGHCCRDSAPQRRSLSS
jgi:hypothetical protein